MIRFIALISFALASIAPLASHAKGYEKAQAVYKASRTPKSSELKDSLWKVTALASIPGADDLDGAWSNGKIPAGDGSFFTQTMALKVYSHASGSVSGGANDYDLVIGQVEVRDTSSKQTLSVVKHTGSVDAKGFRLLANGDSQTCATRTECRLTKAGHLLCAQSNDDSRAVCKNAYKKSPSAYIQYSR